MVKLILKHIAIALFILWMAWVTITVAVMNVIIGIASQQEHTTTHRDIYR